MTTGVQWQWQLLLCLAILAGSVAASAWTILRKKNNNPHTVPPPSTGGRAPHVDGSTSMAAMWRSRWSGVHPAWLLALRATAVVALAAVLLWDLRTYDPSIMMYHTEWILLLEIIYFGVATLFSAYGCFTHTGTRSNEPARNVRLLPRSNSMENEDGAEKRAGRCLGRFMQILYQVCGGAAVLTDVVFWVLMVHFVSSVHFSLNAMSHH